jgi:transposase
MDNARFHHSKIIKDYCDTKNWQIIYTPPYSPWFNPIERVFSIIKNHFRKHRSIENAFDSIDSKKIDNILMTAYKEVEIAKRVRSL